MDTIRRELNKEFGNMEVKYIYGKNAIVDGIEYELQNIYGNISISDKAIRNSAHNASEFANLLSSEVERMCNKIKTAIANMTMFIDKNAMAVYSLNDWDWLADENGNILKRMADKPIYTATLVRYLVIAPKGGANGK